MLYLRLQAVAFLVLASTIGAAQVPSNLPPEIQKRVKEDMELGQRICDDYRKKLNVEAGFIESRDENGDKVADFILHLGSLRCSEEGIAPFCGSGGCSLMVFGSFPDRRYEVVFEDNVRTAQFRFVGRRPAILVTVHGTFCGGSGADNCQKALVWDGKRFTWPEQEAH